MALGRKGAGRRGEGEAPVWVCRVAEWRSARHSLQLAAAPHRTYCDAWRVTMRTVALGLCRGSSVPPTQTHRERCGYQRRAGSWGGGVGRSGICQDLGIKDAEKITVLGRVRDSIQKRGWLPGGQGPWMEVQERGMVTVMSQSPFLASGGGQCRGEWKAL